MSDDAIKRARAAFDAYAGLDAPELPSDSSGSPAAWLADLQVLLARWQGRNFGGATIEQMALGMSEEVGEFAHAVLKHGQRIRGMSDPEAFRAAAGDAIADVVIYAIQAATCLRLDFGTLVHETAQRVMRREWNASPDDGGER